MNRIFLSTLHKDALSYSGHAASVAGEHEYGAMVELQRDVTGNKVSSATSAPQMGFESTPAGDLQPESGWKEID
jgi:hypothetical protein